MTIRIRTVGLGKQARPFIDVLWRVYRDDPVWTPPLLRQLSSQLDPKHNPFLRYGKAQLFVVERDGEAVGRISAHTNPEHDARYDERGGFFGFFECIDDADTVGALLESAEDWLAGQGVDWVRGPVSFTLNQETGTLIDGFDTPPMVAMPHGRPYYDAQLQAAGYAKVKDLLAWKYSVSEPDPRMQRIHDRVLAELDGLEIREFSLKHLRRDVGIAVDIFNDAWHDNWGFVPVREDEIDQLADDLKQFADPQLTALVSIHGEPVAMVVAVPNVNEAARDVNGRLFPFGAIKVKWRLWRGPHTGRVMLLGIRRAYRTRAYAGLALLLFSQIHMRGQRRRYDWAELGWVLENNNLLNSWLRRADAEIYKRYRIYQKDGPFPSA
jgi:hypothetical protein